jgi:Lrp/AsnC family leucine-responsive transcriptional regulator
LEPVTKRTVDALPRQASNDVVRTNEGARVQIDPLDRAILGVLQDDGRISIQQLADRVGLSRAAAYARVRRLESSGVIARYAAVVDPQAAGFDLLCFIGVRVAVHSHEVVERTRTALAALPQVLECHHVTGQFDYLLKVALRDRAELERFIVERLTAVPGIERINTSLVLHVAKSTTAYPLTSDTAQEGER